MSRGPGSVAYGSDAFGGVISVRDAPGRAGLAAVGAVQRHDRRRHPGAARRVEVSKGLANGGVLFAAHTARPTTGTARRGGLQLRLQRSRLPGPRRTRGGPGQLLGVAGRATSAATSSGRATTRRRSASTIRPKTRTASPPATKPRDVAGFQRVGVTGFLGTYDQLTDQDRFATATTGRTIERADIAANDFHVRGFGERLLGKARVEFGVDVNGRFDLHAIDDLITYDLAGDVVSTRPNVSVDTAHRTDTGVYRQIDSRRRARRLSVGAGIRGDYVTTENTGGYFGDRSTGNGAVSGYASATVGSSAGVSLTAQIARGFRDPVLSDRYYRGPTGRGFITGNPDLDPETSLQYDLARALRGAGVPRRRVLLPLRDRRPDRALLDRHRFLLLPQPRHGARARLRSRRPGDVPGGFTLDIAAQVAEGRALDDNAYLDDISPVNLVGDAAQAVRRARVRPGARRVLLGRRSLRADGARGARLHDARRAARAIASSRPLELRVQARNLLNEEYFASQDVRTDSGPGRRCR